jgi:hypothetical protein
MPTDRSLIDWQQPSRNMHVLDWRERAHEFGLLPVGDMADGPPAPGVIEPPQRLLTEREREVLRLRFGLGMDRELTLEEIGRRMSLTRERVRQIVVAATEKMRAARGRAA